MRISFDWLKSIIHIEKSAEEIADILTSLGLEVEGIERVEKVKGGLRGVVVGEVMDCIPHPNADRLKLARVKYRPDQDALQIVCGAPNIAVGQKVLVATIGTSLYPNSGETLTIKKSKIRGEESNGMICSQAELGIGTDHSGILILDSGVSIGQSAADYLNIESDIIFEIGLTPNRSDATSHLGVARDLAAWYKVHEKSEKIIFIEDELIDLPKQSGSNDLNIQVHQSSLCPRYSGVCIDGIKVGESPEWLKRRLISMDQKPINNIVDITNFVLFQYGQPLHAFNRTTIAGNRIQVTTMPSDTSFVTLDNQLIKLSDQDLMICDGNSNPLCMAGVMGGLNSAVDEDTQSIFLESAYFNPSSIRRSSMYHLLRSNAAKIFEKGADPNMTMKALKAASKLIIEIAGGRISSDWIDIYPRVIDPVEINININEVNSLSGMSFEEESLKEVLNGLRFEYTDLRDGNYKVCIGTNKADVTRQADVVEEICRVYGLDHIPIPEKIKISFPTDIISTHELRQTLSNYLSSKGLNEIQTLSLCSSDVCIRSGIWKSEQLVYINNTSNANLDILLPSLSIGGLNALSFNNNRQLTDLAFFEIGKEYHHLEDTYREKSILGIYLFGNKSLAHWKNPKPMSYDIFDLKTLVEELFNHLGIHFESKSEQHNSVFENSLSYTSGSEPLACIGQLKISLSKLFDLKKPVYYAEIDIHKLNQLSRDRKSIYQEVSKFPSSSRDLAIVIDAHIPYHQLESLVHQSASNNLKEVSLFDIYKNPEQLGTNKISYALSFLFESADHSLTSTELDKEIENIIQQLETKLQARVRR
ncbi:MAG: phenylalanine--tRNA ligase subunit beta [Saprospiraceae bacterium]|nr:phenylalanine--tRNA ligase subunit beta [Saprospiraceae bacterium]